MIVVAAAGYAVFQADSNANSLQLQVSSLSSTVSTLSAQVTSLVDKPTVTVTTTSTVTSSTTVTATGTVQVQESTGANFTNVPCQASVPNASGTYALICTNLGLIVVALSNSSIVATTVDNFENLANSNFYNDLVWHRIVPGFVIQTGDPNTRNGGGDRTTWGTGTSGSTIPLQIDPSLHNIAGSIAMASPSGGLASSQFYINLVNNSASLDGKYAVFGQVVSGMNVVNAIASVPIYTSSSSAYYDQPTSPSSAYIVSITIETVP